MIYTRGRSILDDIATADLRWFLLQDNGYVYDPAHDLMTDLVLGTHEVTSTGYARVTLTGGARTINDTLGHIEYRADDPDFGTLTTGQSVAAFGLYKHVTNDADSVPVGYWARDTAVDTAAFDPFVAGFFTGSLIAYLDEV